ncbi:MAG: hypothetical protein F7B17_08530 [Desulfurococcales archaeon]|nr:hypothetical protein [Desulfurococcales archaeon]
MVVEWVLRKVLMRWVGSEARKLEAQRATAAIGDSKLVELARRAEEALLEVEVPGFDVDLVTSGAVKRIRVSRDGAAVAVFIDFSGSDPSCNFCRFINWNLWQAILEKAEARLREAGFKEVAFFDWATGARMEYKPSR